MSEEELWTDAMPEEELPEEELFTDPRLQRYAHVSRMTTHRERARGRLGFYLIGSRAIRYSWKEHIVPWLRSREQRTRAQKHAAAAVDEDKTQRPAAAA